MGGFGRPVGDSGRGVGARTKWGVSNTEQVKHTALPEDVALLEQVDAVHPLLRTLPFQQQQHAEAVLLSYSKDDLRELMKDLGTDTNLTFCLLREEFPSICPQHRLLTCS